MESLLEHKDYLNYEISKGVRYVLACETSEGYAYFNPLSESTQGLDEKADRLLKQIPDMKGQLHLLKLKAMGLDLPGKVMVLASDLKYSELQRVYETGGIARNVLNNSRLSDILKISSFTEEVVKIYES